MSFVHTSSLELLPLLFQIQPHQQDVSAAATFHEQLLHSEIDKICGHGPTIDMKLFLSNDQQSSESQQVNFTTVQKILSAVDAFIFRVMSLDLSRENITEELSALNFNPEQIEVFLRVLEGRRAELCRAMKQKTITEISHSYLQDFDWKLNLVVASDKCSNIREPIVLLNLFVKSENENKLKEILVELTRKDLDHILNEFGKIQHQIQKISI
ncbi:hypothetical protein FDP41_006626 [Naegleria fowleri]|uniref:COMM domain-containing protein n=1 Tax=Naegleria fowleri TaxID=5763 RepID=A0A6A5BKL7_NAEFO|nr:uncharacterized protein FDP41_006626 [Naegleria fowleri]KAF0974594.1 hypothetical protein FDP41_006626 [Naegleria fowleri]CAG4714156.1 unnamed protein product [Naegleria fowleri]